MSRNHHPLKKQEYALEYIMRTSRFIRALTNVSRSMRTPFSTFWSLSAIMAACLIVISPEAYAQAGFAEAMGGTDSDEGTGIAVDASGNVYTTGSFEGTADFDPGVNTFDLISAGGVDIFVSMLDASVDLLWATALGCTGADHALGIAVDGSGHVHTPAP